MAANGFDVRPISGSTGAKILGIGLAAEPDHHTIASIRQAWLEQGVIFFRDQGLSQEKFLAVAKRFGDAVECQFIKGIEGFPEIIPVTKLKDEKLILGRSAHRLSRNP